MEDQAKGYQVLVSGPCFLAWAIWEPEGGDPCRWRARGLRRAEGPDTHTMGGVLTAALGWCRWKSRQGRRSLQDRAGGSQSGARSRSQPCT